MTTGQGLAHAIIWSTIYSSKKDSREKDSTLTDDQVALITAKGTLEDYCGTLFDSAKKSTGNRKRNIRLIYHLPTAICIFNKICEETGCKNYSPIDNTDEYRWMCDSMARHGIITKDCKLSDFTDEQITKVADDIYIDILPTVVEDIACGILDLEDGKISKIEYNEYMTFRGTV